MKELYDFSDIPHEEDSKEKFYRFIEVVLWCVAIGVVWSFLIIPFAVNYYMNL